MIKLVDNIIICMKLFHYRLLLLRANNMIRCGKNTYVAPASSMLSSFRPSIHFPIYALAKLHIVHITWHVVK